MLKKTRVFQKEWSEKVILKSDQDHDLEFSQKVISDKIAILDHFLSQSLWIFLQQFSEHKFRFNISSRVGTLSK